MEFLAFVFENDNSTIFHIEYKSLWYSKISIGYPSAWKGYLSKTGLSKRSIT